MEEKGDLTEKRKLGRREGGKEAEKEWGGEEGEE